MFHQLKDHRNSKVTINTPPLGEYLCVLELRLKTSCVLGKFNTLFLCFF